MGAGRVGIKAAVFSLSFKERAGERMVLISGQQQRATKLKLPRHFGA